MHMSPVSLRIDALVEQLGEQIVHDPFYESEPWDHLALVINLHPRTQMFGYVYVADDWEAASPDSTEPLDTARRLQAAMREQSNTLWRRSLITIDRHTAKMDIHFDYEGTRWVPDPSDPEQFALSLKPGARGRE
jgi:hypothetical protein